MQNCGFGYQNRILDGALVADTQSSALPVSNLRTQQGATSLGWRIPGLNGGLTLTLPGLSALRVASLHRTNLTAAAQWSVTIYNAGAAVWSGQGGPVAGGQSLVCAPEAVLGDSVRLSLSDPANPDGWMDIPLAYIGPLWQPVRNFSTQSTAGGTLGADTITALGGAEFVTPRWYQRTGSITHQSLGTAEATIVAQIVRTAATGQNILFLPDPSASALAEQALFGRLSGGDLSNPFGAADRHAITLNMTERL